MLTTKTSGLVAGVSLGMFLAAPILFANVHALEITIQSDGRIDFYQDEVLGDSTLAQGNSDAARPSNSISPSENRKVNVKATDDGIEVDLERRNRGNAGFTDAESTTAKRLRMQMPAEQSQRQQDLLDDTTVSDDETDETTATRRNNAHFDRLRQERQERSDELIELTNSLTSDGEESLELETRDIRARIKRGAQFTYDPETNAITLTTPSGNVHTLNHLPDQAIDRMIAAGVVVPQVTDEAGETVVEIEEGEDGLVYKTVGIHRKRLLGLFPRQIETEVTLNDDTGEVIEEEVASDSFITQVLDTLSF